MTVLAIDFGTSNTVVCLYNLVHGQPETLDLYPLSMRYGQAPPLIPSLVHIDVRDQVTIGQPVRQHSDISRILKGFKRDLCQAFQPAPTYINQRSYTPKDAAVLFLKQLFAHLEAQKIQPTELIFSTPVGTYESYHHLLTDVARELGYSQVQFIDESTAAALGYGVQNPGQIILVIDLGGGTLDLSLVKIVKPEINQSIYQGEVLAKTDRAYGCGGMDIDRWIAEDCLKKHGRTRKDIGESAWQNLLMISEKVKIRLSQYELAEESFLDENTFETWKISLKRQDLEDILEKHGFLRLLREAIDEVLEIGYSKGISKKEIHHVLLVGGSSLIPAVQSQVFSLFGRERVHCDKPFEAVAHGALALTQFKGINDHLRHTYALRHYNPFTKANEYYPLFKSGSSYPCTAPTLYLQANHTGQQQIQLVVGEYIPSGGTEVYYDEQGMLQLRSSDADSSFRPLGLQNAVQFPLNPPGVKGEDRLSVNFFIDPGRTLKVDVFDMKNQTFILEQQAVARLQ